MRKKATPRHNPQKLTPARRAVVNKAVDRLKERLLFQDPISMEWVGKSRGVELNKQLYDARSMKTMLNRGMAFVPHSRRALSLAERARIVGVATHSDTLAAALVEAYRRAAEDDKEQPRFAWTLERPSSQQFATALRLGSATFTVRYRTQVRVYAGARLLATITKIQPAKSALTWPEARVLDGTPAQLAIVRPAVHDAMRRLVR